MGIYHIMDFTGERFIPDIGLGNEIEAEHYQRYHAISECVAGKVVLDAASGSGYGSNIISKSASKVYGVELDLEAIEFAKSKFQTPNLQFICANIAHLPLGDNSVDVVVSFETIEHVDEQTQQFFLQEIKRVLRKDGLLIMSSPEKSVYSDLLNYSNEFHQKEFYAQEFVDFLKHFFQHVQLAVQFMALGYFLKNNNSNLINILDLHTEKVNKAKYLLAFCGDQEIHVDDLLIGNVVIDKTGNYYQKLQRIIDLQEENSEKNRVIDHAYSLVNEKHQEIQKLTGEVGEAKQSWLEKDKNIEVLESACKDNKIQLNLTLQELKETHLQVSRHKERLGALEDELEHIYSRKLWKLFQFIYKLKNKIWPF